MDDLLTDAAGTRHQPAGADARIASLVPSLTELLFDLNLDKQLVARTAFCVHPAEQAKAVASVGGTKSINFEKLRALAPTHVLVNIDETPRALAESLSAEGWTVVVTHPIDVRDNLALYRLLGGIFDRCAEADVLCSRFEAAYAAAENATRLQRQRRVLYLIWKNPWMSVAQETYISRMLELGGLHTLPENCSLRYPVVPLSEELLEQVDFVLFSSEPFPFKEQHLADFRTLHPAHAGKAMMIDAQMISWYGSRAIAGLQYLARFIQALD